jgi:uncharacterized protein (UPF0548 family)
MRWTRGIDLEEFYTAELTYAERGETRDRLPSGYRHVVRRQQIGDGQATFDRAVDVLLSWQMHRRAGLVMLSAPPTATPYSVVVMRLGPPVVGVVVPCRVVYVEDEPNRRGFAYGTLPRHPEIGEEAFLVEMTSDERVYFLVRAFSRPATLWSRAGGPLTHAIQDVVTDRYVRALRQLSRP